ncbi:HNH endonuclease [Ralstonia pickettii]|uniref:HNH endonuclease n=1 Tax=Ralstonia pickettii TaxID=329 RepID=A0A7X2HLJ1_RALPI|nr:HNH endonuclease [Ralstonia pickettii]MRS98737.1 HNH endonuclease [Ralstonia pickettii]
MVQLFPRADTHVEIALDAAQHLVRLLERHNWAMTSEHRLYYSRWRRFWRGMTRVERAIVVMYVESNNGVMFRGRTVKLYNLPQALRSTDTRRRRSHATDSVLREFDNLEQIFTYAGVDVEQIKLRRRITHHDEMALFGPDLTDATPLASDGGVNLDAALEEQWQFREREQAILECVRDEEDDPDTVDFVGSLPVKSTSRERLGLGRLGQDKYRDDMLALWSNACAVTGCSIAAVLVASHAKRWADSTDCERLDPNCGFR